MTMMEAKDKAGLKRAAHSSTIADFFQPNPDKRRVMDKYARMYHDMPLEQLLIQIDKNDSGQRQSADPQMRE